MTKIYLFLLFCLHNVGGQIVDTTQGLIRGLASEDGSYYMYLGIPYGVVDPDNPFGPSSPHPAFETTFDAVNDSAICPQFDAFRGGLLGSLDCLHLNVFSPASAANLPVMVFIHGGGFALGFYGSEIYNPKSLLRHEIVVVTLNYRLGPFGFMCTDDSRVPGNQGLRDQLMALRWIHDNIANFGGDASKVTLVGNSAGSTSVDLQIIRSHDPQLFNQGVLQSGTSYLPFYQPTQRTAPLIIAKHFGFESEDMHDALDFLSTVDSLDIIAAVTRLGLSFGPCVEKPFEDVEAFLTENWMKKEVIPAKDFKIMIGFNDNEALGLFATPGQDLANLVENSLRPVFDVNSEDFQGMMAVSHFFFGDEEAYGNKLQEIIDLRSDLSFVYLSMRNIERFLKSEVEKVYLYVFAYDGERNILKNRLNTTHEGAAHGDEIGYLWDVSYLGVPNEDDQEIVDRMTAMWANFVKYGDPTPELTSLLPVKWEAIRQNSPYHYLHIDANMQGGARPYHDRMAFWDLFYEINADLQLHLMDF